MAVLHHGRAIAGTVEIDRFEILVLLQADAVEHVARQDRQAGALAPKATGWPTRSLMVL